MRLDSSSAARPRLEVSAAALRRSQHVQHVGLDAPPLLCAGRLQPLLARRPTASSSGAGPSIRQVPISNSTAFQARGASSRSTWASACSSACRPSPARPWDHARLADQPPGLGQAAFVALALERLDRRLRLRHQIVGVRLGLDQEPHTRPPHA